MAPEITGEQRDALYEEIVTRLSGIDAVFRVVINGEFEAAQRLARDFADDLQLLVADLGWGERTDRPAIELTSPPDVLRRVLKRHHRSASDRLAIERDQVREAKDGEADCLLVMGTCQAILEELGGE